MKKMFLVFIVLLFVGCAGSTYQYPSHSEQYATVSPIENKEHKADIFGNSTIFIEAINGKRTSDMWNGRNSMQKVYPGKIVLYIEEDNSRLPFIYATEMIFNAEQGKKYIISSKHILKDGKVIGVVFYLLNNNKIILETKSEKIKRGAPLYIPVML